MERNRPLLASAGILFLLGIVEADGAEMKTLKVVERAATDVITDLGDKGDSVGDVLTFHNLVFDEKNENQIGTNQGWCIRTEVGKSWECFWTMILGDGQITVAGPFSTLPIRARGNRRNGYLRLGERRDDAPFPQRPGKRVRLRLYVGVVTVSPPVLPPRAFRAPPTSPAIPNSARTKSCRCPARALATAVAFSGSA